jgi:hypothetical protein
MFSVLGAVQEKYLFQKIDIAVSNVENLSLFSQEHG